MQNKFEVKDSSVSFMLAMVLPNVLAFFILLIAGIVTGDIVNVESTLFYKIMATVLSQTAFIFVYFFILKRKKMPFLKSFEKSKLSFKQIIIIILIGLVSLFLISPIINVFDEFLVYIGIPSSNLPININKPINFIYLVLTLGILAPISEELLFRGIIFNGLKQKGIKTAVLISSLMFMLVHLNLHQTIYQFILGVILALAVLYTNNIFSSVLIHFINNTLVLLINYINPYFFSYKFLSFNYIILALVLLFVAVVTLLLLFKKLKNLRKIDKTELISDNFVGQKQKNNNDYFILSLVFAIILWIVTVVISL